MYKRTRHLCFLLLLMMATSSIVAAEAKTLSLALGEPLSQSEIRSYSITIFPDGTNLPKGQGSVQQGASLYEAQCMMCHGESGIEGPAARLAGSDGWFSLSDPLRVLRIKKYPILLISVGGLWPYATSIYDYIRRAMPHYAPKSLSNDEVYALTAYILYLNEIIDDDVVLNDQRILELSMPAKARSISAWVDQ